MDNIKNNNQQFHHFTQLPLPIMDNNTNMDHGIPSISFSGSLSDDYQSPLVAIGNAISILGDNSQNQNLNKYREPLCDISNQNFNSENSELIGNTAENILLINNNNELVQQVIDKNLDRQNNYVYQILMECGEGQFLIKAYDYEQSNSSDRQIETKKSSPFSIHKVARIVIYHEQKRTGSYSISSERLDELAQSAANLFSNISKERFYTKATSNSNAHGVLASFYETLREKAIQINEIKLIKKSHKRKLSDFDDTVSENLIALTNGTNIIIDEEYIKKWNLVPQQEKIECYKKFNYKQIFTTFSILRNPVGYYLIKADFCSFYGKSEELFHNNWKTIAQKIIDIAQKRKYYGKDIRTILENNKNIEREDHRNTVALVLLPYLFKKIHKLTKKSKFGQTWHPTKSEVLNAFIYHIKETDNFKGRLEAAKATVQDLYESHYLEVKPYVVINGPDLDKINSAYVIIDQHMYQVPSTTFAIDLCFQCIKVFQKSYSIICNHLWQFIESEIYKFEVPNKYSCVTEVIDKINQNC